MLPPTDPLKPLNATSKNPSSARSQTQCLAQTSQRRKTDSLHEHPFTLTNGITQDLSTSPETILYLAYGSNLCAETFQGNRGIRPLSQLNVVVPELTMTFDLAGFPYIEPCFANTRYRNPTPPHSPLPPAPESLSEKSPLLPRKAPDYHKTRWKKGLVGVVYEVSRADYAHIIATEGGGVSYHDVLVDCYDLPPSGDTVPAFPSSTPFKAHTLYSPFVPPGSHSGKCGRFSRPDPAYAQPSARYLKLITDGADEHALPSEYKQYLHGIRSYTMTTTRQRLGAWIFGLIWVPLIRGGFALSSVFSDEDGKAPGWVVAVTGALLKGMWASYDLFFVKAFGDGERTIYEDEDGDVDEGRVGLRIGRRSASAVGYGDSDEKALDGYQEV